jgi:hypothetical protein
MRIRPFGCIALFVMLVALSVPLSGHHGSTLLYDMNRNVTMKGVVTSFQYKNPHVYINYDVKDAKGHVVNWVVETYAPIVMVKRDGWTRDTFKIGDEIIVTVWPARSGAPRGFLAKLVMPTGVTLYGMLWEVPALVAEPQAALA